MIEPVIDKLLKSPALILTVVCLCLAGALWTSMSVADVNAKNTSAETVQRQVRMMVDSGKYEFELPERYGPPRSIDERVESSPDNDKGDGGDQPETRNDRRESMRNDGRSKGESTGELRVSPVVRVVFWIMLILVALFFIVPLVSGAKRPLSSVSEKRKSESIAVRRSGKKSIDAEFRPTDRVTPSASTSIIDRARQLSATGQFTEAIHTLLLSALARLEQHRVVTQVSKLTSREVLDRLGTENKVAQGKPAIDKLVQAVEISRFGRYQPGDRDVEEQILAYLQLCDALEALNHRPSPALGA